MTTMRPYNPETDRDACHRIWREVGWMEADNKTQAAAFDLFIQAGRALVAEVNGEAECLVLSAPGTIRHIKDDLPFNCITGVTTSRVARKQKLAGRLTARAIAESVADGAIVSGLGMFEQGYYDRLGYGTGSYECFLVLEPATLRIPAATRPPRRISADDAEAIHANRLARLRAHGSCTLTPVNITRAEMQWEDKGFGLGFFDGPNGELSHHICLIAGDNVENGPYRVHWMAYQNREQFRELLGLIKTLGDQISAVRMTEPQGIQLQDLLDKPFSRYRVTRKSDFDANPRALAYWQMRLCDVPAALAKTNLRGTDLKFNLDVTDPIEPLLPDDSAWRGVAGRYVVSLGEPSAAEPGHDASLPTLTSTVNAFTRLWLGVRPATGLAVTDELTGPEELLEELNWAFRLPRPTTDWDF